MHLCLGNSRGEKYLEQAKGPLQQNHISVQCLDVFLDVLICFIHIQLEIMKFCKKSAFLLGMCWPVIVHR